MRFSICWQRKKIVLDTQRIADLLHVSFIKAQGSGCEVYTNNSLLCETMSKHAPATCRDLFSLRMRMMPRLQKQHCGVAGPTDRTRVRLQTFSIKEVASAHVACFVAQPCSKLKLSNLFAIIHSALATQPFGLCVRQARHCGQLLDGHAGRGNRAWFYTAKVALCESECASLAWV